ncbi:uncharacterized protein LOC116287993 [Actinia tenebrosa]|uniref:Uncharacterized protein LOC116287993 n=1 Tax=Actinia tenebrosa TaxID=6105 RepID=A0A6P8HCY7_ACTTE|nr:uncharacterized protein LOC116287993 [Actinia tenebrosa]
MGRTEDKLKRIYYGPEDYWRGASAIKKLAAAARVYLPVPKYIPRPSFTVNAPNEVHQADLLFLPHDKVRRKTYRYALTVVDIASRYKDAEPITSKDFGEVAEALGRIYKRVLKWPKLLQVDAGTEFMGVVTNTLKDHDTKIRRAEAEYHRGQSIVERFNKTLAGRLFGYQYWKELEDPSKRNREWTQRLPQVVAALNNEAARATGMKPKDAMKKKHLEHKSYVRRSRALGLKEKKLPRNIVVRYLYQPGKLAGGSKRATDPNWSLKTYEISKSVTKEGQPVLYYLDGPSRGFVKEELLIVPKDSEWCCSTRPITL